MFTHGFSCSGNTSLKLQCIHIHKTSVGTLVLVLDYLLICLHHGNQMTK
jgi:hypothetical protein